MSDGQPLGKRLLKWGVRLLGIALLVFVVGQVGFADSLTLADGTELSGRIEGEIPASVADWAAGASVAFESDDGTLREFTLEQLATDEVEGGAVPKVSEGLFRLARRSDPVWMVPAFLLFGFTMHFGVVRWWLLLRAAEIRISFWECHRLTFLGLFFNNVAPGATGGDLVKAVYIARRAPTKRMAAVVSVFVDRIIGLLALVAIGGIAILPNLDNPRFREPAAFIYLVLGGAAIASAVFFSRRIRRWLRIEEIAAKLPGGALLQRVDEAVFVYRYRKRTLVHAVLLSFGNQLAIQILTIMFAVGLGVTTESGEAVSFLDYLAVLPVAYTLSAIPSLPGGWGVREAAFAICLYFIGVGRNPAVALAVCAGLNATLWSLLGGVYFLMDRSAGNVDARDVETPAAG